MIIKVKDIPELSELPLRATPKSAAYDVFAVSEPEIVGEKDGEYWKRIDYIQYRTSLYTAPQPSSYYTGSAQAQEYHILIHPRSSVSKYNLLLANSIGLVDSDYRGEILVRYKYIWSPEDLLISVNPDEERTKQLNDTLYILNCKMICKINIDRIYKKGDKVAQLVAEPTTEAEWVRVEELDITERKGGFGSSGI